MNMLHDPRVATLRALSGGATAVVLMAFLMYPNTGLGNNELQILTDKTDKTITRALRALERLGLIQSHGRYNGYRLTAICRQMLLGEDPILEFGTTGTGKFTTPDPSSSSSTSLSSSYEEPLLPPPTTDREPENLRLPPDYQAAQDNLTRYVSMPPKASGPALLAAYQRGDHPDLILEHAYTWLAYCQDPERASINNAPWFIARQIEDGVPPPRDYHPPARYQYNARIYAHHRRYLNWLAGRPGDPDHDDVGLPDPENSHG